ncbi:hypothetical protein EFQ99_24425 [Rhizobium vallis]|uniref:Uncharacterized protein n=1 Tax=Rhizobium vallis TaxID=634290 RepID=A0A3S0S8J5_9HYPH|nr:hypothetical protein [Rhizobium vallis]RUM23175.1 hypothetical protein EFQ99_24425 [Rhizobium vallis]
MRTKGEYQRVLDDDVDEILVRIWKLDGAVVAEADHPTLEHISGQLITAALGNPVTVPEALAIANKWLDQLPLKRIFIYIEDPSDWNEDWGILLPPKPSAIIVKPFRA